MRTLTALLAGPAPALIALDSLRAAEPPSYPIGGRYGLAAHKRGPSLEAAKDVIDDATRECTDTGRWFDFKGNVRVDHFTGRPLTFTLKHVQFTPPDTYYLVEGERIGDSFILHKSSEAMIDIVMTDGASVYIQLWMVNCGSIRASPTK